VAETPSHQPPAEGRSARKRREIMDAATAVFLQNGYKGTSMDQIAALAAVSKQTVYKHFSDKESLFAAIIGGTAEPVDELDQAMAQPLQTPDDLEKSLGELARWFITFITSPRVRQLRRLVIGEAGRFPELGRSWYQQGFEHGMTMLASCLGALAERGHLRMDDPQLAANHFAGLVLWVPVNQAMFYGDHDEVSEADVNRYADEGVRVFISAYGSAGPR
jgi:TetR/AcrR family transcriptional repressor of mexJK operon